MAFSLSPFHHHYADAFDRGLPGIIHSFTFILYIGFRVLMLMLVVIITIAIIIIFIIILCFFPNNNLLYFIATFVLLFVFIC